MRLRRAAPASAADVAAGGSLRSLRHRDFRVFWFGFGLSVLGYQVQRVGLGLLAYDLTGSPFFLALVFSGDSLPMLALSAVGGAMSDRWDRRRLLMASRTLVAALAFTIAVLVTSDLIAVWHLLVFALLTGIGYAVDVPARQAMIRDLVPDEDFVNAVALVSIIRQVSRIVGPALGSLAVVWVGVQGAFALTTVGQLACVLTVAFVRLPHRPPPTSEGALAHLRAGFAFVRSAGAVRLLLLISTVSSLSALAYQPLIPVFAKDVLHKGDAATGLLLSAAGAGALVGAVAVARSSHRLTSPRAAAVTAVLFSLSVAAFARATALPLALLFLALAGMTNVLSSIGITSSIQRRTPQALQGRVMGVYQTTWELQALGGLLVGAVAEAVGAPLALLAICALSGVALLLLLPRPELREPAPAPTLLAPS